jgi:uncharacterized protein YciI
MFVIILSYIKPIEVIDALRPAHLEFLDRYFAKNIFITSGRQNPLKGGVIMATGVSRSEIEQIITEDPFHTEKVATFEIIEFNPTKVSPNVKDLLKIA